MKRFLNILKRLIPYKHALGLSILFNLLMAVFTIAGIPLFIPFFELIFYGNQAGSTAASNHGIKADLIRIFGDFLVQDDPRQMLIHIIWLIIVIFVLKNVFRYLALFFISPVRTGFLRDLRQQLFDHLNTLPVQFFKRNRKGDLLSRMSMDIQEIEGSILNILETLIKSPLLILGSLAFMFYVSYELTLLVIGLIPFTIIVIGGISRTLKKQSLVTQEKLGELLSILEEAVSGNKIIKSFGAIRQVTSKFSATNNLHRKLLTRLLWRKELGSPVAEVLAVGVIAILMYYAAELVFAQKLAPDTFFAFIYAFFIIIEPAKSFSSAYYSYKKGDAALERLERIFETENPIIEPEGAISQFEFNRQIEYKNVTYSYPESRKQFELKDIQLTLKKGEKVALVGRSGAGKTTLADLLPRFMDYETGDILIDGTPIRSMKIETLRNLIGIVPQDAILFNDTLANNISLGQRRVDPEALHKAAEVANIADFIQAQPNGWETRIGDMGSKLSGGQRQRIAIARAVLKDAPILILDEATSSLDSASEKKVQQALNNLLKNKTALIIAHRLSTIMECDQIIVLEEGRIIERGNHRELMDKKGEYYKFVQLQTLKTDWNE